MNYMSQLERVLTNLPVKVLFAGFTSDTMTLQRNGWQLALSQSFDGYDYGAELALRFKDSNCTFMGRARSGDFSRIREYMCKNDMASFYQYIVFEVNCFTTGNIEYRLVSHITPKFMAWDASEPMIQDMTTFNPFKDSLFRTFDSSKELVVDPDDVSRMMDLILKSQKPNQEHIMKRKIMREKVDNLWAAPEKKMHLQLVS